MEFMESTSLTKFTMTSMVPTSMAILINTGVLLCPTWGCNIKYYILVAYMDRLAQPDQFWDENPHQNNDHKKLVSCFVNANPSCSRTRSDELKKVQKVVTWSQTRLRMRVVSLGLEAAWPPAGVWGQCRILKTERSHFDSRLPMSVCDTWGQCYKTFLLR